MLAYNLFIGLTNSSLANYSWLHMTDGCQALFLINVTINQLPNINFDVSYEEIIQKIFKKLKSQILNLKWNQNLWFFCGFVLMFQKYGQVS